MRIEEAGVGDIPVIRQLAYAIWPHAYGKIITPEQLRYMLETIYSEAGLCLQMETGQHFVLLYDENDAPSGFAAYGLKADETPISYRLHKLYVLPSSQGKGYGQSLLEHVIAKVKNEGGSKIDLTVNRKNPAQYFYHKLGFEIIREEDKDIGGGFFMNDYVLERRV